MLNGEIPQHRKRLGQHKPPQPLHDGQDLDLGGVAAIGKMIFCRRP